MNDKLTSAVNAMFLLSRECQVGGGPQNCVGQRTLCAYRKQYADKVHYVQESKRKLTCSMHTMRTESNMQKRHTMRKEGCRDVSYGH